MIRSEKYGEDTSLSIRQVDTMAETTLRQYLRIQWKGYGLEPAKVWRCTIARGLGFGAIPMTLEIRAV
ncbi:MAG TPA: hypothetical protein VGR15_09215 [Bacteroidota bacterium]|nr:hypothetical protein [Bacteroidota bacterium]